MGCSESAEKKPASATRLGQPHNIGVLSVEDLQNEYRDDSSIDIEGFSDSDSPRVSVSSPVRIHGPGKLRASSNRYRSISFISNPPSVSGHHKTKNREQRPRHRRAPSRNSRHSAPRSSFEKSSSYQRRYDEDYAATYRDDGSSTSSWSSDVPQLYYMGSNNTSSKGEGTWEWWYDMVKDEQITRDVLVKEYLSDLRNWLRCKKYKNGESVELDLSWLYPEPSAPQAIATFLTSSRIEEMKWITTLRLDGNIFSSSGFGLLLSTLANANGRESSPSVLPHLRNLFLNHMNLDRDLVSLVLHVLFPIDYASSIGDRNKAVRIGSSVVSRPVALEASSFTVNGTDEGLDSSLTLVRPLFPSLRTLSFSDNESLGVVGLVHVLRSFIATHYEPHYLSVLDLSRCGIDESGMYYLREFLNGLDVAVQSHRNPVIPHRLLLYGNPMKEAWRVRTTQSPSYDNRIKLNSSSSALLRHSVAHSGRHSSRRKRNNRRWVELKWRAQ